MLARAEEDAAELDRTPVASMELLSTPRACDSQYLCLEAASEAKPSEPEDECDPVGKPTREWAERRPYETEEDECWYAEGRREIVAATPCADIAQAVRHGFARN